MRHKADSSMRLFVFSLLAVAIISASCDSTITTGGECRALASNELVLASCAPPTEQWSLAMCEAGSLDCSKQYYVTFSTGAWDNPLYYISNSLVPIILTSGQIVLGDYIGTYGNYGDSASLPDVIMHWNESQDGSLLDIVCSGKVSGDKMSGECTQSSVFSGQTTTNVWKAERGRIDVENGAFEKDIATGKTRLYFSAWTEKASRVYITADFMDGQVDLVKCGKTDLYMDAWMISKTPMLSSDVQIPSPAPEPPNMSGCLNEGYYEFPSTSSPLVVKTHIVNPAGEIVREKAVTDVWSEQALEFSTVDADLHSGIPTSQQIVIREDSTWDEIWRLHKTNTVPIPESPSVDFSRKMVVGVFLGWSPYSCNSVNITSVKVVGGEMLYVIYHVGRPSRISPCAEAITHPSHIVLVDKSDLPVEFIAQ